MHSIQFECRLLEMQVIGLGWDNKWGKASTDPWKTKELRTKIAVNVAAEDTARKRLESRRKRRSM